MSGDMALQELFSASSAALGVIGRRGVFLYARKAVSGWPHVSYNESTHINLIF